MKVEIWQSDLNERWFFSVRANTWDMGSLSPAHTTPAAARRAFFRAADTITKLAAAEREKGKKP